MGCCLGDDIIVDASPRGGPRRIRLAVLLSEMQAVLTGEEVAGVVDLAVAAETIGYDAVFMGEHIVMGPSAAADGMPPNLHAPLRPRGIPPATPWLEPLTTLAVVAGATTTIGLGTAILIAPLRPAVLTAKIVHTLDVLAKGRLELGVGVSWQTEEYDALGVPYSQRGQLLDDALSAWSALADPGPVSLVSETVSFEGIHLEPRSQQPGGPPIWFGGAFGKRMIRRVVRHGRGLAPLPRASSDDLSILAAAMIGAGRNPNELDLITGIRPKFDNAVGPADLAASLAEISSLVELGYTTFVLWPGAFAAHRDELGDVLQQAHDVFRRLTAGGTSVALRQSL